MVILLNEAAAGLCRYHSECQSKAAGQACFWRAALEQCESHFPRCLLRPQGQGLHCICQHSRFPWPSLRFWWFRYRQPVLVHRAPTKHARLAKTLARLGGDPFVCDVGITWMPEWMPDTDVKPHQCVPPRSVSTEVMREHSRPPWFLSIRSGFTSVVYAKIIGTIPGYLVFSCTGYFRQSSPTNPELKLVRKPSLM